MATKELLRLKDIVVKRIVEGVATITYELKSICNGVGVNTSIRELVMFNVTLNQLQDDVKSLIAYQEQLELINVELAEIEKEGTHK